MIRLTEEKTKAWLAARGLPVPKGAVANTPDEAAAIVDRFGGGVIKALVATGRRGKAGAVKVVANAAEAKPAAASVLAVQIGEHSVERLYVESKVSIDKEFYLAFAFDGRSPSVVASINGGVDIEEVHRQSPESIIHRPIDSVTGIRFWEALDLWQSAKAPNENLASLAKITVELWQAFRGADALTLELNPLAVTADKKVSLVGAMMGIDDNALFRQPQWQAESGEQTIGGRKQTKGELAVAEANRTLPGGAVRYTELEGNIGLLVGGGGASLLVHDMILARGGKPANHTDSSPGPITEKLKVMLREILTRPNMAGLLIAYNHLQMARCDVKIEALADALRKTGVDPRKFPIVVRLAGPAEARARELAAEFPGIQYLDDDASLDDAVRLIVEKAGKGGLREASA
ncbi:MAG: acetate--CoA ligase family protein [Xanthobacteraceae bacterium]|nr:acetate--CoA ligase family protein [Xanthobacteraceae bacterium]MCW5676321.1 acetate--CoA ligase family protein [Xanthobacteraceae bacterium]